VPSVRADSDSCLRVLQVSAFFAAHGGGIEAVADQLARRLPGVGFQVRWMAGGARREAPDDIPSGLVCDHVRSWDPLERHLGLPFPLWGPAGLVRLWRAVKWCQVVHVHDYLYMPSLAALLFAALLRRPVLLTQHIGDIPFGSVVIRTLLRALNRSLGAWVLHRAAQVVFVGRPVMTYFEHWPGFRRVPLLVPNGVDHARYRAQAQHARGPEVQLLFVGRFVEKKGMVALRGCAQLSGSRWTYVGWGPLSPDYWGDDERRGNVILGRLPAEAVVPHYQNADLLVLPSTGEGFPLVLQEALACGTPVLVSTEVFESFPATESGCVFHVEMRQPNAAVALHERLCELVADPSRLTAARPHAAALAQQWDWSTCVARYAELYRSVARPAPPRPDVLVAD